MDDEPEPDSPRRPSLNEALQDLTPERMLALAGVTGLLMVGLITLILIIGAATGDDDSGLGPVAGARRTPTPVPTPTPTPSPTPVPLTEEQRAARQAAADVLGDQGFNVVRLSDYNPQHTLRVLLGEHPTRGRKAFFFVQDRGFIGTDSTNPSARLRIVKQTTTQVTLSYRLYAEGDLRSAPRGESVKVRFKWDGASLEPRDEPPPVEQRDPALRREG